MRSTYAWQTKRQEIKERANFLCEVCRDKDHRFVYDNVEVHHIEKIKDAPGLFLDDLNLICLCKEHHEAADGGDLSKEYLKRLAAQREEKSAKL